jgi:hypothetical protein
MNALTAEWVEKAERDFQTALRVMCALSGHEVTLAMGQAALAASAL